MGKQLTVEPPIAQLPISRTCETPINPAGEFVLLLIFDDLHRYSFLYDSLKKISKSCRRISGDLHALRCVSKSMQRKLGGKEFSSLRNWLGLSTSSECNSVITPESQFMGGDAVSSSPYPSPSRWKL